MKEEESQLWGRWVEQHDQAARDALILLHAAWARLVARDVFIRVRSRNSDWNEFAQNATIGLIEAVDRYDPGRNIGFRAFARHRVRGAVFNGLRQLWGRNVAAIRDTSTSLERSEALDANGEDPFESFVTWTIGIGVGHLLDSASMPETPAYPRGPYATVERDQRAELLRRLVQLLPERERMVLTLHYFQHVRFVEIAEMMTVTKGRVSQLHKRGVTRLRECLRAYGDDAHDPTIL